MTASSATAAAALATDTEEHGTDRTSWPARLLGCASVLGGTAAIGAHAALYGYWIVDDAGITFAYARNVAEGFGPVLQSGAPAVEGFSNPTWMLLLIIGRWLGVFDQGLLLGFPDYAVYPKALALLCCLGILTACYLAASRVTKRPWLVTLAAGLALAAIPSFVIWSFSGLENSLYALLAVVLAVLIFRAVVDDRLLSPRVAILAGLLAAAAALTRPDGLVYAGAYPIVTLILLRRSAAGASIRNIALSIAAFAVPFAGYVLWRYATFGRLLPNTAVAKSQDIPSLETLNRAGELVLYLGTAVVLVLAAIVGMALAERLWWHRALLALLVPLGLALLAFVVLNPDWMPQYRFATPIWALGALIGTLTTAAALRHGWGRRKLWVSAALAVTTAASGTSLAQAAQEFRASPTVAMCGVADRYGRTFNGYADVLKLEHASLLLPDIGGTALTSRLRIYDMAGLASPKIADSMSDGDMAGMRNYIFTELQPTFIHSHGAWSTATDIPSDSRLQEDYYRIYRHPTADVPNGDWVRKEAIGDERTLQTLRAHARQAIQEASGDWPRRHCGATLRRGQTEVGLY